MRWVILWVVVGLTFLACWVGLHHNPSDVPSPLIGKRMPTWTLPSWQAQPLEPTFWLQATRPTLVVVWNRHCAVCQRTYSTLVERAQRTSSEVRWVLWAYRNTAKDVNAWYQDHGHFPGTVVLDPQGAFGTELGVYGTPETYLVDRFGVVREKWVGELSPQQWLLKVLPAIHQAKRALPGQHAVLGTELLTLRQTAAKRGIRPRDTVAGPVEARYAFSDPAKHQAFLSTLQRLRCLVCQNESLLGSQASLAESLREVVYLAYRLDVPPHTLKRWLTERYGDAIRYEPPWDPRTWLLWLGPGAVMLVWVGLSQWRRR